MIIILIHMLKNLQQSNLKSKSWNDSIVNGKVQVWYIIEKNPSLKNYPMEVLHYCYRRATFKAANQTGLDYRKFPASCPWQLKEVIGDQNE